MKTCETCQEMEERLEPLAKALDAYEAAPHPSLDSVTKEPEAQEHNRRLREFAQLRRQLLEHRETAHPQERRHQRKAKLRPGVYSSQQLEHHYLVVERDSHHCLVPFPGPEDLITGCTPWERRTRWTHVPDELRADPLDHWQEFACKVCGIPEGLFR